MQNDATSQAAAGQALEITDQATLDAALAASETVEESDEQTEDQASSELQQKEQKEANEKLFAGKYKSPEDLEKAYKSSRSEAEKMAKELNELKKAQQDAKFKEFANLDYAEREQFLLSKIQEQGSQLEQLMAALSGAAVEQEAQTAEQQIESFIASSPLLKEADLAEEFRLIATHPSMQEYTLESIFDVRIKPKLEKLMGRKIKVSPRGVSAVRAEDPKMDIENMSQAEYNANREKILKANGINI